MNTKNTEFPVVFPVTCHTQHVGPGSTFVAILGLREDGVQYIPEALAKGAKTIVVGTHVELLPEMAELIKERRAVLLRVDEPRRALAELSAQALGYPAKKLKFVAITGTKGKTTTTFLTEYLLRAAGYKTALLSTVKNQILSTVYPTKLTTQQPDYLNVFFSECVKQGVEWVVFEVAAQAFSLFRVHGIYFDVGIFTNFSREHGEFYDTQEAYFEAKTRVLDHLKQGAPLLFNAKDQRVAEVCSGYAYAQPFTNVSGYTCPQLVGTFNAFNISAATRCAEFLGVTKPVIQKALEQFEGVPGRLNRYPLPNGAIAFIDYAHNPASFEAVLEQLRQLTQHLIIVFGAGGERDPGRRPIMGAIAARFGHEVILTTDNPRSEDPAAIIAQIQSGVPPASAGKITVELDRESAIRLAYARSRQGSVIALLGKGAEEYQVVGTARLPFSERAIVLSLGKDDKA